MHWLVVAMLVTCIGCGTILNGGTSTIVPPPGATVDGVPGPMPANQQHAHEVVYADGRRCIVESHVSAGYVIADILLWNFLISVLVDAVTGDWKTLDAGACPGVIVN
jgi:hypothetical protein